MGRGGKGEVALGVTFIESTGGRVQNNKKGRVKQLLCFTKPE
jgi:hypothetical protein